MYKRFHKFKQYQRYYLFDSSTGMAYRINRRLFDYFEPENRLSLSQIKSAGIEKNIENSIVTPQQENPGNSFHLTSITLHVSQLCNMKCIYCFAEPTKSDSLGLMSKTTAYAAVDFLLDHSPAPSNISIIFFGGEPLMNYSLIKAVVPYALNKSSNQNKKIFFSITTNGSLLNDEISTFLNKYNFSVVISIDGDEYTQNNQRPMKNGSPSFGIVKAKIQEFLLSRNGQATARVTFTSLSSNPSTIRKALKKLGFRKIHLEPVTEELNSPLTLNERKSAEYIRDIYNQGLELISIIKNRNIPSGSLLLKYVFFLMSNKYISDFCGAGKKSLAVSTKGFIYPCHRFVGDKDYILGNLFSKTYDQPKFLTLRKEYRNLCKECWAETYCGGGCYNINKAFSGDPLIPFYGMCNSITNYLKTAVGVYDHLNLEDRKYIRSVKNRKIPENSQN